MLPGTGISELMSEGRSIGMSPIQRRQDRAIAFCLGHQKHRCEHARERQVRSGEAVGCEERSVAEEIRRKGDLFPHDSSRASGVFVIDRKPSPQDRTPCREDGSEEQRLERANIRARARAQAV